MTWCFELMNFKNKGFSEKLQIQKDQGKREVRMKNGSISLTNKGS